MGTIEIRSAEKAMLPDIRIQRVDAYRQYIEVLPADHWNALHKAISSTADEQDGVELITALLDGKLAGSVALFPAKTDAYEGYVDELDYPEIRMLAVAPEARGKGAATALIKECIRRARAKGYGAIGLHTGEFMKDAIKVYESFGFKRLPQFDFEPADDGIIVRAYQLNI
ncbi:GNAT family N-acetyltransferase [Peribacillus sp. SCS-37]|uniref:GNAT family N-acetyltransferase n=1 Tax=Paraperibacillus esterisolvens TaxID=3115296 RepID=UPI003906A4B0